jgi:hypothetical protein
MKKSYLACVILGLLCVKGAQASDAVRIMEEAAPTVGDPVSVAGKFVVDPSSSNRAWMEARVISDRIVDADNDPEIVTVQKKVPGLIFDSKTHEVLYRPEGATASVVCGTYVEGGIFTHSRVKPSGLCNFVSKVERRDADDGFRTKKKTYLLIDFVVER